MKCRCVTSTKRKIHGRHTYLSVTAQHSLHMPLHCLLEHPLQDMSLRHTFKGCCNAKARSQRNQCPMLPCRVGRYMQITAAFLFAHAKTVTLGFPSWPTVGINMQELAAARMLQHAVVHTQSLWLAIVTSIVTHIAFTLRTPGHPKL